MSDPPSQPVSSGVFAFLFSDIEGSTQRWERDPDAMAAALRRHDRIVRAAMERHRGHVFKTMGDAFCVAFPTPLDAVGAAVEAQRGLATEDFGKIDGMRVRMGIHVGAAEIRGDDYFGQPLNRVARLMATSHGGQVVVSGAVASQVRGQLPGEVSLHDLGEHRLKDLVEPEHAWQIMAPGLPAHFPPLKSAGHYQHNLPDYLATFVGREKESRELGHMIGRNRLVTMLGAGGLGKTRLSVRVGLEQLGSFPDGVWFVELAPLGDPQLVAETVAGTVSVTVPRERSATDALVAALRTRKLLLILDNCEHLVGAAAALAHTLIGACPTVSILASSREALGVPGEKLFRVPPLAWPHKAAGMTAAEALHYPAVRLFAERAAASLGRFELADDQVPAVVGICKRLDGIALAIELAAPRLKMLKPEALLARLDDRFRLFTGGSRTVLPRQQTLRALIDWSHDLLSPAERMLMRRLAVFAGDWTLDGAAAVTVGDGIDEWEMFDLLTSLVDKSLVVTVMSDSTTRYNFLESTRAYAAEKLAEAGEGHWRRRLAEYLAGLLKEAETRYETTATIEWRGAYGPEIDNVRAALDWAFGPEGDVPLGLAVTAYSSWLWSELDLAAEERRRLEVATPLIDEATPPAVAARIYYMRTAVRAMGLASAQADARRAVELARQAKDKVALGRGLLHLARTLLAPATLAEAGTVLDEVLPIARAGGRTKLLAAVLNGVGIAAFYAGDQRTARRFFEESLSIAHSVEDIQGVNAVVQNVAELQFIEGDTAAAIETARDGINAAREAEDQESECRISANLGAYLLLEGEFEEGASIAAFGLRQAVALGIDYVITWTIQHLALAATRRGRAVDAARLQGFVDAAYAAERASREPTEQMSCDLVMAFLTTAMTDSGLTAMLAEGAALDRESAVALALTAASA